jgi:SAM-dependent MidA family methyltransferase
VETSEALRQIQFKNLCGNADGQKVLPKSLESYKYKNSSNINILWLDDVCQLPRNEAVHFYLANEFFDALPIHKFQVGLLLPYQYTYIMRRFL